MLGVSIIIDPVHRAKAQMIVEMPKAWETTEVINDEEETKIGRAHV